VLVDRVSHSRLDFQLADSRSSLLRCACTGVSHDTYQSIELAQQHPCLARFLVGWSNLRWVRQPESCHVDRIEIFSNRAETSYSFSYCGPL